MEQIGQARVHLQRVVDALLSRADRDLDAVPGGDARDDRLRLLRRFAASQGTLDRLVRLLELLGGLLVLVRLVVLLLLVLILLLASLLLSLALLLEESLHLLHGLLEGLLELLADL